MDLADKREHISESVYHPRAGFNNNNNNKKRLKSLHSD